MKKFDKFVNNFISESILDIGRDALDPNVFQTFDNGAPPLLRDGIKKQIMKDINDINTVIPVNNFFVIGSILTKNYTKDSDIDVNVEIDPADTDAVSTAEILHLVRKLNGKLAVGTLHPINYFVISEPYDFAKSDGVYDVGNERWLKTPKNINPDVTKAVEHFQSILHDVDVMTGTLRRKLVDYEKLKELKPTELKHLHSVMGQKLNEIQEAIVHLANEYHDVTILRRMAFDKALTPEEIRVLGSRNNLPENIVYKLLQKYYYLDFIRKIKHLSDTGVMPDDIPALKQAGEEMWS